MGEFGYLNLGRAINGNYRTWIADSLCQECTDNMAESHISWIVLKLRHNFGFLMFLAMENTAVKQCTAVSVYIVLCTQHVERSVSVLVFSSPSSPVQRMKPLSLAASSRCPTVKTEEPRTILADVHALPAENWPCTPHLVSVIPQCVNILHPNNASRHHGAMWDLFCHFIDSATLFMSHVAEWICFQ